MLKMNEAVQAEACQRSLCLSIDGCQRVCLLKLVNDHCVCLLMGCQLSTVIYRRLHVTLLCLSDDGCQLYVHGCQLPTVDGYQRLHVTLCKIGLGKAVKAHSHTRQCHVLVIIAGLSMI